jgi:AcrR family transcriptional regulator
VPPLRERKKARIRETIEAAALQLFATRGYDATSVQQIAEAADVSVRTFYRYFDSKDAIMFARFDGYLDTLIGLLRTRDRTVDPLESLIAAVATFASHLEHERDWMLQFGRVAGDHLALLLRSLHLQFVWEHAISAELARQAGVAPGDVRVSVLTNAVSGAYRAALEGWQIAGGARPLDADIRDALELLAGLRDIASSLFPPPPV